MGSVVLMMDLESGLLRGKMERMGSPENRENWRTRKTVFNCVKCVSGFKERGNNLFKYMVGRISKNEFKLKQGRFKLA